MDGVKFNNANPKGEPIISICIGTFRKQEILNEVLISIKEKNRLCPHPYEIIVADDCPKASSLEVVRDNGAYYIWNANCQHKNPSIPRNCSFRLARGNLIIHQSDDVVWQTENSIELFKQLTEDRQAVFATVYNVDMSTKEIIEVYTGKERQKPYFFLGAFRREDMVFYDENYIFPAYDDDRLAIDLQKNGINFMWTDKIVAWHALHDKGEMSNGQDSAAWHYKRNIRSF